MDDLKTLVYLLVDSHNQYATWSDLLITGKCDSDESRTMAFNRADYHSTVACNLRARIIQKVVEDYGYNMVNGRYFEKEILKK